MTTLRDSLLARLAEIREAADHATPGPWDHKGWFFGAAREESYAVWQGSAPQGPGEGPAPLARTSRLKQGWDDAAHIAACSPDRMVRLYQGLSAEVEAHRPKKRQSRGRPGCHDCWTCGAVIHSDGACPFVRRLAAMLGLNTEPATPGGSSE